MPHETRGDLPDNVRSALRDVPHAQDIYKEAFNSAWAQYADPQDRREGYDREEAAHAVAWNALTQKYAPGDDGRWHLKGE